MARLSEKGASSFGTLLREYRLAAHLSQELLAERARMSVDAIGALERGVRHSPQRQTLALLVEALALEGDDRTRLERAAQREPSPRRRARVVAGHVLSDRPDELIGRADDLAALAASLAQRRAITIVGTGGVGKTRLARSLAVVTRERFADGIWLVELGPLGAAASVGQEIASVLGVETHSTRSLDELLAAALRDKQLLLVLDDCEHVIDDVADTTCMLLARCARLTVLATSREALRIDGEFVYPLLPLSAADAAQLFAERAAARDPAFRLDAANAPLVDELCRRLDGVPFAIELAAAKVPMMPLRELARRLDERFGLLTDGKRNVAPRHRTLRALVDWSYALLSEPERAFLRRLAVFPAQWTIDGCRAVCCAAPLRASDALPLLSSLTTKSLVVAERRGEESAFRLLDSTRAYARERLAEDGELPALRQAHAEFVRELARRAERDLPRTPEAAWLDAVGCEFENVRAALQWALDEANAPALGAQIVAALGFFWHSRRYRDGAHWLALAVARADQLDPACAGHVLAESVRTNPFTEEAFALASRAVAAYRRCGDARGLLLALEYHGQSLINAGRYADAAEPLGEALALARTAGEQDRVGRLFALTGFAQLYGGDAAAARAAFDAAYAAATRAGRDRDVALSLRGRAELELALTQPREALEDALRALDLFEDLGDERAGAWQRYQVAHALLLDGRAAEALSYAASAIETLHDAQIPLTYVEALDVAAAILVRLGDPCGAVVVGALARRRRAELASFRISPLVERLAQDARAVVERELAPSDRARMEELGERIDDRDAIAMLARR
ncbi:MAG TPA: helix-turn-helix domain-containing protein [Candidatus Limnocylindria bacterium]|jgi:predicted ATPase/DNA-binding XRE family transcriptional regulator|nr:helix-turn-helix domain-containing protein [Candidatus Limnocylindria bacterium]